MAETLTRGQLARRARVHPETIRYYERRALIPVAERSPSGYRRFPPSTVGRIEFIRRAQKLGLSLEEIRGLLSMEATTPENAGELRRNIRGTLTDIEARIQELRALHQEITRLAERSRSPSIVSAVGGARSPVRT